jgi:translation initiation factor 2 alpha subunit (eIF-2alpha)
MEVKVDDLVMCSVDKIEGTTVFVKIEGYGPGTIMFSEIAAGRIRNIREYVFPNKKIVCKVLKISPDHIELSLRRVTGKEREEMEEKYQKEKTFQGMLKTISTNPAEIIAKIKEKYDIGEFIENVRENPSTLSEFLKKEDVEKITKILSEKKEKAKEVKKIIKINDDSESGINDIKYTLDVKNVEIRYLGSSQFSVTAKAKDFKSAQNVLDSAIQEIQKRAKERKAVLEIKEK